MKPKYTVILYTSGKQREEIASLSMAAATRQMKEWMKRYQDSSPIVDIKITGTWIIGS